MILGIGVDLVTVARMAGLIERHGERPAERILAAAELGGRQSGADDRVDLPLVLLLDGELCVCDIMAVLQLPQSTVSRHLAYLKNSGWVDDRRCGVWMYYSIVDNGNTLQKRLVESLRENLPALEVAVTDRERLNGFSQHNSCA